MPDESMRVKAMLDPSGDHTGHASCAARMRGAAADAGRARTRSMEAAASAFMAERYGAGVRET